MPGVALSRAHSIGHAHIGHARAWLAINTDIWAGAEHAIAFVGDEQQTQAVASLAPCGHVAERSFDGALALGVAPGSRPDLHRHGWRLLLATSSIISRTMWTVPPASTELDHAALRHSRTSNESNTVNASS